MERSLAHIEIVTKIDELPGYDRVALAQILGWRVVVAKEEIKEGDKVIYFEIDSLVPKDDERFAFMVKKNYRIKTQKMCKVISQGLAMPLSLFPELGDPEIGTDVTKELGITYYLAGDRDRKKKARVTDDDRYKRMMNRHPKIAKLKISRWLMKRKWGKKLLFLFFGKVKDNERRFPTKFEYVNKTDEPKVENLPVDFLKNKEKWIQTTKLDGTSSTYILERKSRNKFEYYVCSRNVRQLTDDQKSYFDTNVYWEMESKYHIKDMLKDMLIKHPELDYICIQGETVGVGVQGNPHKLLDTQFFGFNLIDSVNGRWNSIKAKEQVAKYGIQWVPIKSVNYILPDTIEELKAQADGNLSEDLPGASGLREGFVYRSLDGKRSFKNVSNKYLLKNQDKLEKLEEENNA